MNSEKDDYGEQSHGNLEIQADKCDSTLNNKETMQARVLTYATEREQRVNSFLEGVREKRAQFIKDKLPAKQTLVSSSEIATQYNTNSNTNIDISI